MTFYKSKFKTVHFYTTKYVANLTRALSQMFLRDLKIMTSGITCDQIVHTTDIIRNRENPTELMFILIPQLLVPDSNSLPDPRKYCIYQLEQLNDKNKITGDGGVMVKTDFGPIMTEVIRNSVASYDYSSINVTHYPTELQQFIKILVPPIYNQYHHQNQIGMMMPDMSPIDILFYGGMNDRRDRILKHITGRLQADCGAGITVVNRVFGDDLLKLIAKARVVLNIHYYTNSILETDRIHAALQFENVTVVSEYPTQRDDLLSVYEAHPRVFFCDEIIDCVDNVDNNVLIEKLIQTCIVALSSAKINNQISSNSNNGNNVDINAICAKTLTTSIV